MDLALQSTDGNVRRIAQSIRQDSEFWHKIEMIRKARDVTVSVKPVIDTARYGSYGIPDFVEIGIPIEEIA